MLIFFKQIKTVSKISNKDYNSMNLAVCYYYQKTKIKCRFNADLYFSSINITTETAPHSQLNDISLVKRHNVMNSIC